MSTPMAINVISTIMPTRNCITRSFMIDPSNGRKSGARGQGKAEGGRGKEEKK